MTSFTISYVLPSCPRIHVSVVRGSDPGDVAVRYSRRRGIRLVFFLADMFSPLHGFARYCDKRHHYIDVSINPNRKD